MVTAIENLMRYCINRKDAEHAKKILTFSFLPILVK
jgi:hypothetical protein